MLRPSLLCVARVLVLLTSLLCTGLVAVPGAIAAPPHRSTVQPLERAHAHDDDEHERPLPDALDHGFTSAETDGQLIRVDQS